MPMFSSRSPKNRAATKLALASRNSVSIGFNQLRVRLEIPPSHGQTPIISRLITGYGLVVNITGALLGEKTQGYGYFDLELRGTVHQIRQGLTFLESLDVTVLGKPGTSGDGWHC